MVGRIERESGLTAVGLRLHSSGLPEADDVAFGVFEVGCEAHVRDWLFLLDSLAAVLLDALERSINVLDINCYHCCMVRVVVPLGQAAVDGAWFCGHLCLLVDLGGVDHVVLHSGVLVDVPAEGLLVEVLGAFYIVGGYFEVYYSAVMHDFFT